MNREPLPVEALATEDQRRTSSIEKQIAFQKCITSPDSRFDDLDMEIDDMTILDPHEIHAPSRKSDAELNRVLSILDNLENGKETTR